MARHRLLPLLVGALVVLVAPPAEPAGSAPAPRGPRQAYEASLGQPPRQLAPTGRLGREWRGTPTGVAGSVGYRSGELIIEDRVFDDTGADRTTDAPQLGLQDVYDGLCQGTQVYRHGDVEYPDDGRYGDNAADLVHVRLAADAHHTYVLFQLQTLIDAETTVVLLGIDADGDPETGPIGWDGFEHLLVVHDGAATLDGTPVDAATDLDANTIEARIPRSLVDGPTWRVTAAAAVAADPEPVVMDLAVQDEEIVGTWNCWHDADQSQRIAAGAFPAVSVDLGDLRAGRSDAVGLDRGPMVRLQVPWRSFGEGTRHQPRYAENGNSARIFGGVVQPYAAYVPDSYDPSRSNPLVVLLHCLNCNHNTFHIASWPGLADLAEQLGAVVVTPFGFGEGGHYEVEAEHDVFDVLTDVRARYAIDPDRIVLTGMSMGALGTYRLGLLYPDLWARALAVGSYTGPYCVTPSQRTGCPYTAINYFRLLGSARNLPFALLNGVLDELTPYTGALEIADELSSLGYPWRLWSYPTRRHEPSLHGLTAETTAPWIAEARRIGDPAHVTYRMERILENPALGLVHDRAYWLHDLVMADDVEVATVDARSGRGTVLQTEPVSASGADDAGPWRLDGADPISGRLDEGNEVSLTTAGLKALAVRTTQAGLSTSERLVLRVDTDRPLLVTVAGFGSVTAPAGRSEHHLEAGAAAADAGAAAPGGRLPATGGGDGVAALVLLVLGGAGISVRRMARPRASCPGDRC